ncbi:MAG: preprotein translocase subunit SecE [Acidimicrobiia bacterium]|nr:preprotein translocase subunit SecE [Acidimicrobiia bacterium]
MNRQMKRMMQRQGQVGADGEPVAQQRQRPRPQTKPVERRTTPAEFFRQVRAELRKVAWPNRAEVINYSVIVFVVLVVLIAMIFGLDYVFGKFVFFLFKK